MKQSTFYLEPTIQVVKEAVIAETKVIQHLTNEFVQQYETLAAEKIVSEIYF